MARGNERHRNSRAKIQARVPVVRFRLDCGVVISHDGVIAERRDDACAMRGCDPRQRDDIKMIVVAVRHQYDVDRRQVGKCNTWIVDPFRSDKAERRCTHRPHGIA